MGPSPSPRCLKIDRRLWTSPSQNRTLPTGNHHDLHIVTGGSSPALLSPIMYVHSQKDLIKNRKALIAIMCVLVMLPPPGFAGQAIDIRSPQPIESGPF